MQTETIIILILSAQVGLSSSWFNVGLISLVAIFGFGDFDFLGEMFSGCLVRCEVFLERLSKRVRKWFIFFIG